MLQHMPSIKVSYTIQIVSTLHTFGKAGTLFATKIEPGCAFRLPKLYCLVQLLHDTSEMAHDMK